jgi:hypothetical protein
MTKKELMRALEPIAEDSVIVCMGEDGGWDNIEEVNIEQNAIVFGGGSPFTDDDPFRDNTPDQAQR